MTKAMVPSKLGFAFETDAAGWRVPVLVVAAAPYKPAGANEFFIRRQGSSLSRKESKNGFRTDPPETGYIPANVTQKKGMNAYEYSK
jgi:hypothetical protein